MVIANISYLMSKPKDTMVKGPANRRGLPFTQSAFAKRTSYAPIRQCHHAGVDQHQRHVRPRQALGRPLGGQHQAEGDEGGHLPHPVQRQLEHLHDEQRRRRRPGGNSMESTCLCMNYGIRSYRQSNPTCPSHCLKRWPATPKTWIPMAPMVRRSRATSSRRQPS